MLKAGTAGEEIHLFDRARHHTDFPYVGRLTVVSQILYTDCPSHFTFKVI